MYHDNWQEIIKKALKRGSANRHDKADKLISMNQTTAIFSGEYEYETG